LSQYLLRPLRPLRPLRLLTLSGNRRYNPFRLDQLRQSLQ
jgi:hypothetical protein